MGREGGTSGGEDMVCVMGDWLADICGLHKLEGGNEVQRGQKEREWGQGSLPAASISPFPQL